MSAQRNITDFTLSEAEKLIAALGEKAFRARQIFEWIYKKNADGFASMKNLPPGLRRRLEAEFVFSPLSLATEKVSRDGTRKLLFSLADGEKIESVIIPAAGRTTVCVSTQAGCKFGCRFCASGLGGWKRDLTVSEILGQILFAKRLLKNKPVTHIVFMGTGEPLDNYENLLKAVSILNAEEGLNIGARRITVSTCGLVPQIARLAAEGRQIELSISLHGYDEESRRVLMPVSRRYGFKELIAVCREYSKKTKRQITFEYILIKGVTLTPEAPKKLAQTFRGIICKMNLIPYNPVPEFETSTLLRPCPESDPVLKPGSQRIDFTPPSHSEVLAFRQELARQGIDATVRTPRGSDIAAACGQLRYQGMKKQ